MDILTIAEDWFNKDVVNLEIETLLNPGQHGHKEFETVYDLLPVPPFPAYQEPNAWTYGEDTVVSQVAPERAYNDAKSQHLWPVAWQYEVESSTQGQESQKAKPEPVKVKDDLSIEYDVHDLRPYELPVMGTYVDQAITPGFSYKVRRLGTEKYLFGGKRLPLISIGKGYGKRITFKGDAANYNDNYFYSDTEDEGYGFIIQAVNNGQVLTIKRDERIVGSLTILDVLECSQQEVKSSAENGDVCKHVTVAFSCNMALKSERGGLLSLLSERNLQVTGIAVLRKNKKDREAKLVGVDKVTLPHTGPCVLVPY